MINTAGKIQATEEIQNKIYTIRGVQVMLDEDLAKLYKVETSAFNRAVKRNIDRFPNEFRFQLTKDELEILRCQIGILRFAHGKHRKYLPYAFTEQGVTMLSAVLRSDTAIKRSIQIINAFVEMRKFIVANEGLLDRVASVELKQLTYKSESDKKFNKLFDALGDGELKAKQGIFYNGQVFDAYVFVSKIIKSAKRSIILIDNFIDESVLQLLAKRGKEVNVVIYTKKIAKGLRQDLEKYNAQYESSKIEIKIFTKAHDRFLIIDDTILYHFGASLKDLGRKWFAFSRFKDSAFEMLLKLRHI